MTDTNPLKVNDFMSISDDQTDTGMGVFGESVYSGVTLAPTSFQVDSTEIVDANTGIIAAGFFVVFDVRRQGLAGSGFASNKKYITVPQVTIYINNDNDSTWAYPIGSALLASGIVLPIISIIPQYTPLNADESQPTDTFADGHQQFHLTFFNFEPIANVTCYYHVRFLTIPSRGQPLNDQQ